MEMEMWMEMAMEMAMEMEMWMEMVMEKVMVIFGARTARSELRFATKWLLTSDFEVLEASGAPKGDQERPKKFPKAPKKLPRSPQEAPKRFLGGALKVLEVQDAPRATILDTFIGFRASKSPPRGPQVTIYPPCRRFRASTRGTGALDFRLSRT